MLDLDSYGTSSFELGDVPQTPPHITHTEIIYVFPQLRMAKQSPRQFLEIKPWGKLLQQQQIFLTLLNVL